MIPGPDSRQSEPCLCGQISAKSSAANGAGMRPRGICPVLLLCSLLLFVAPQPGWAVTGVVRLQGTFMQYQDEMQGWAPETWRSILDTMRAAKMDTIIIQMLVRENNDGTTHSIIGPAGQPDATETILDYADTNGWRVYLGTYMSSWNHDMLASNFLYETQTRISAAFGPSVLRTSPLTPPLLSEAKSRRLGTPTLHALTLHRSHARA